MNDGDIKVIAKNFDRNTLGKTKLIRSGLCMSSPSPLHRLAAQHFDERYKRKQRESFLSQPEHTIWVSELLEPNIYIWVFCFKSII